MNSNCKESLTSYVTALLEESVTYDEIVVDGVVHPAGTPLSRLLDAGDDLCEALFDDASDALSNFRAECSAELGFDPCTFFDPVRVARDYAQSRSIWNFFGHGFVDASYEIVSTGPEGQKQKMNVSFDLHRVAKNCGTHDLILWVDQQHAGGDLPALRLEAKPR